MSIDGVGKPKAPAPPIGVGGAGSTTSAQRGETFAVPPNAPSERPLETDPLSRLGRGELGLDEYLNLRVSEATRHLEGKLPSEQLDFVRLSLREQLHTDPVLVELVRRTTGSDPGGQGL